MNISFAASTLPTDGVVVVGVLEDNTLTPSAHRLDEQLAGALGRAMAASRFKGKKDQSLAILAPGGSALERVLLVGLGKAEELTALKAQGIGGGIQAALAATGHTTATVLVDAIDGAPIGAGDLAAEMAQGALLRSYRFDKYRTKEKDEDKPKLATLTFAGEDHDAAAARFVSLSAVADGVFLTRDLASEPANIIYPESFAAAARGLTALGVEVEVLGEEAMRALGMNALLGVGQGSARESQMVILQWRGAGDTAGDADSPGPLAFIGKGVTFDTGGISIKPAANMEEMKWDMGGAATVVGLMKALAGRKAKVNVIGAVGLVENMPSGTAQRPGDVVTSMSGQTIEVINTDAEGRLVLCDVLHYINDRFKPRFLVDLATLTGAIIIALGHEIAGLFSNTDDLADKLVAAGKVVDEPLWRMPLGEAYDKQLKSDIADMRNIGVRGAGSITAAQFLQRFVGTTPWAHLDIAGMAWSKDNRDVVPKGASGFGVRLLDRFVADNYES